VDKEQILERWQRHYEELLGGREETTTAANEQTETLNTGKVEEPSLIEVEMALKSLKIINLQEYTSYRLTTEVWRKGSITSFSPIN
jgi:hypothetical protein